MPLSIYTSVILPPQFQLFLSFFKTLHNTPVEVELKNGYRLKGILNTVDQYHNVKLLKVEAAEPQKYPHLQSVDELFIRGSVIRYISVQPESVNLDLLHDSCRRANLLSGPAK